MLSSIRYISYKAKKSCRKGKQPYKYREHNDVQDKNQHLSSISLAAGVPNLQRNCREISHSCGKKIRQRRGGSVCRSWEGGETWWCSAGDRRGEIDRRGTTTRAVARPAASRWRRSGAGRGDCGASGGVEVAAQRGRAQRLVGVEAAARPAVGGLTAPRREQETDCEESRL
jgi:hypothetical protein